MIPSTPDADAERFMAVALEEARQAAQRGEVPVGAVIVRHGEIIARAGNRKEEHRDPTAHAEVLAIREAAAACANWRLEDVELYVTLEPCVMCCGAIIAARIPRVYYACSDEKYGGISLFAMTADQRLNHQVDARRGLLEQRCRQLLETFFSTRRAEHPPLPYIHTGP